MRGDDKDKINVRDRQWASSSSEKHDRWFLDVFSGTKYLLHIIFNLKDFY